MVIETNESVFNVDADAIVNTINCDGFMGKGIALEFALRYPGLLKKYQEECKRHEIDVRKIYYYEENDLNGVKTKIINFPTKKQFKLPSRMDWVEDGLRDFCARYKELGITSVAFPLLGAANGGLDTNQVISIMKKYLESLDIECYICYAKNLSGKEKEMVEAFKSTSVGQLANIARLNSKQMNILEMNKDRISHFYEIGNLASIGATTYEKFFKYFYINIPKVQEQLTLY